MEEWTANAQELRLAQTSQTTPTLEEPASSEGTGQASEPVDETSSADFESGEMTPPDSLSQGMETPAESTVTPPAPQEAASDQNLMEGVSTPPPPAYGAEGSGELGAPLTEGSAVTEEGQPTPNPASGQEAGLTSQPSSFPSPEIEPPLGFLPFLVFGFGTIAALIVFFSRRRKNWNEIGDEMHDEGTLSSKHESRIATQFSEIKDLGDYQTQHSRQVSTFE